ncbi:MAG: poly-beta-1,6 N-acetyl-D-glucosamine export porin PgaA [Pigmentiphaga sp.]|nr:poly-beta-1,6 N-acetyl-D-glucosamine export porin PgaA [Pigmentiphaga sp.]
MVHAQQASYEPLLTQARSHRDAQRWDAALDLFREGARRYPGVASFEQGEVMTLADAGQAEEAVRRGRALVQRNPADPDNHLALGYAYLRAEGPYAALSEVDRAYELAPQRPYVVRERILSWQRAAMPEPALRLARQHPGLLNESQMRQLEGDAAAELARLSSLPSRGEAERFAVADRALARYAQLIPAWQALGEEAAADVRRARIDRLQALHARVRMGEVVAEYEALRAEGVEVPDYALGDVASAYLYLRRPEAAREIYDRLVRNGGKGLDEEMRLANETGLLYAHIEEESFGPALASADGAPAGYSTWRYLVGNPERLPNDPRLLADETAAMAYYYGDDTVEAEKRLSEWVDLAPDNSGLRTSLATVYLGRGWPRRAESEYKLAEALAPRGLDVESGQGFTAMDLQEWRQAELLSADTMARFPENLRAQRLARVWQVHNKAEWRTSAYRGFSSDSPVAGSGSYGFDSVLYSAPLQYNWRAFGGGGYATGKFIEGRGTSRWLRGGLEYRGRDLTAEAELSVNHYGFGAKQGARASVAYDIDDHWQIGGEASLRSRDTPLRALSHNISSNALQGYVRWRQSERREWTLALTPSRFSDGNNRLSAALTGSERLYTRPHLKVDLGLELSASRNTRTDAPYFNPSRDLVFLPSVTVTHILHRRYETVWEQEATVAAGSYTQRDYGTGAVGLISYGQRYRTNDVFEVGATVSGITRPYDGTREHEWRIVADVIFRF